MNQVLKPYFLLACVAFFMGFASYLALGSVLATSAAPVLDGWQASMPTPVAPVDAPLVRSRAI